MENALPWGKSADGHSHHLAHHCADVAACFELISRLPVVRNRMEIAAGRALDEVDLARLAVVVFLHDCGKLHPGFQAKATIGANVWPPQTLHGHVQEGAAIFEGICQGKIMRALHASSIRDWGVQEGLFRAALAHHGRPFVIEEKSRKDWERPNSFGYDPISAASQIGDAMSRWFAEAFLRTGAPLPNTASFQHLFCGLVALSDWLGSTRSLFPFVSALDAHYIVRAREQAERAVSDIGLAVDRWRSAIGGKSSFETLSGGRSPRPSQSLVGEWSLEDQLVILEAETGSGKTEAALWRFAQLFAAGKVDSLYFALPTRAAARQIHERVTDVVQRLMGASAPGTVMAVPGYLQSGNVEGIRLPAFEVLWDDDPDEKTRLARWAAESSRRYMAATIAVGTVDQAMLAALQVKHAHLRAAAICRSFLVIDEVHASDAYMTSIQNHLLKMQIGRGGYAMLMSATLGAEARAVWLSSGRVPVREQAIAAPYPAVWGRKGEVRTIGKDGTRRKHVRMELVRGWTGEIAGLRAIDAATRGAKVLVIRNTVNAAQNTFQAIRAFGAERLLLQVAGGPALHHARFASEDRRLLDRCVERVLSPDVALRCRGGVVIVGTQTVEQSLDIDADVLITDLCPVDVLLQRIGRLHRHAPPRPHAFENPQCFVLSPEGGLEHLVAPAFENGLGQFSGGGGVYRNLHACELTRRLVDTHSEWIIPDMNRFLVEGATHHENIDALNEEMGKAWLKYWQNTYGKDVADAQAAKHLRLPIDRDFMDLMPFADVEAKVRTRLGAEGASIRFVEPVLGPFGQAIGGINLASHWKEVFAEQPVVARAENGTVQFSVEKNTFHYTRAGLMRS